MKRAKFNISWDTHKQIILNINYRLKVNNKIRESLYIRSKKPTSDAKGSSMKLINLFISMKFNKYFVTLISRVNYFQLY